MCARRSALGSLGSDAGSPSAAALASLRNRELTQSQEGLLEAREEFRGRLKLQPFCLDLSVCVLAFWKSASAGLFVLVQQHVCET